MYNLSMKSLNILICNSQSSMNYGGTETYCKEIKEFFLSQGHKCNELCYLVKTNNSNISLSKDINYVFVDDDDKNYKFTKTSLYKFTRWNSAASTFARHIFENKTWKNKLRKLCNENEYDLVIFNMNILCSYRKIAKKSISIQHSDYNFISNQNTKIKIVINNILNIRNHFAQNKNIICFSDHDLTLFQKKFKNKNIYACPLFYKPVSEKNTATNNSGEKLITLFSRYDNAVKNCDLIFDMFEKNNKYLLVISNNIPHDVAAKYRNIIFFNPPDHASAIWKMREKSLALIMISEYEGFPFTLIDSLSNGIPVIVRDSFNNAKFFANKDTGLLLPYKIDVQKYFQEIENTDFVKFDKEKIILFSKVFSLLNFRKIWLGILAKF